MNTNPKDETVKLADDLENAINYFGSGKEMEFIVDRMANTHRTLNQSFTGNFIIRFVRKMALAYKNGRYDARNEWACKYCSAMWDGLCTVNPYYAELKDTDDIGSLPLI